MSWVETTCPPGWSVGGRPRGRGLVARRMDANADYTPVRDGDGCIVWMDSEAAARRLAWERWALEVLGDRVEWEGDHDSQPALCVELASLTLLSVRVPQWGSASYRVTSCGAEWATGEVWECTDPVEALARLAALTLAVIGPEVSSDA